MKPKIERFNISNKPPERIAFKYMHMGRVVYVEDKRKESKHEKGMV